MSKDRWSNTEAPVVPAAVEPEPEAPVAAPSAPAKAELVDVRYCHPQNLACPQIGILSGKSHSHIFKRGEVVKLPRDIATSITNPERKPYGARQWELV